MELHVLLGFSLAGCIVLGYKVYEVATMFAVYRRMTRQLLIDIASGDAEVVIKDRNDGTLHIKATYNRPYL